MSLCLYMRLQMTLLPQVESPCMCDDEDVTVSWLTCVCERQLHKRVHAFTLCPICTKMCRSHTPPFIYSTTVISVSKVLELGSKERRVAAVPEGTESGLELPEKETQKAPSISIVQPGSQWPGGPASCRSSWCSPCQGPHPHPKLKRTDRKVRG